MIHISMIRLSFMFAFFFSICLVLGADSMVQAQNYAPNNAPAGCSSGCGYGNGYGNGYGYTYGYSGERTDPRLGYCLNNDCFAGQGPDAHLNVIRGGGMYGGGYGGGYYGGGFSGGYYYGGGHGCGCRSGHIIR